MSLSTSKMHAELAKGRRQSVSASNKELSMSKLSNPVDVMARAVRVSRHQQSERRESRVRVQSRHLGAVLFFLKITHTAFAMQFISSFDCTYFETTRSWHMTDAVEVVCWSGDEHWQLISWSVLGICLNTIGVPLLFFLLTRFATRRGYKHATTFAGSVFGTRIHDAVRNWQDLHGGSIDDLFHKADTDMTGRVDESEFFDILLQKHLKVFIPHFRRREFFFAVSPYGTAITTEKFKQIVSIAHSCFSIVSAGVSQHFLITPAF